jgi:ATP-dependent Lhr-like helicase
VIAERSRESKAFHSAGPAQAICLPDVDQRALTGLKFNEALPERLATATLAARLADVGSAARVLAEPVRFSVLDG